MKQGVIFIAIILFAITSHAQQLNIATCREMALKHNKQIAIAEAQKRKAEYAVKATKSNFLPNISANALYLHNSEEITANTPNIPLTQGLTIPAMGVGIGVDNTFNAGVSITQPLYTGGKIISSTKMAELGSEIYTINQDKTENQIIVECEQAYWNCIMAIELSKVAKRYKETLNALFDDVNKAEKVGMKSKNELLKVQVKLNQASLNELKSLNGIKVAKMNLCRIIGLDLDSNIELDQNIDYSSNVITEQFTLEEIPEIAILNKRIELQKQSIKLTKSDYLPSAVAMVGYSYTNALTLKGTTPFTQNILPQSERMINGGSLTAFATLKIPIFHWGEGSNKVKEAKEQLTIAEADLEHSKDLITLNIQLAVNRINEAVELKNMTQTALTQAEENLRISYNQYKVGMETLSNLLEAQTSWQQANKDYILSCIEEKLATLNYNQITGQL